MSKPKPIKYSAVEGGPWEHWDDRNEYRNPQGIRFHAIMFDDGTVFDMVNGWRSFTYCQCCGQRTSA